MFIDGFSDASNPRILLRRDEVNTDPIQEIADFLMARDENRYGPPPTSKKFLNKLPIKKMKKEDVKEENDCAVCKDKFIEGDNIIEIPCKHIFHPDCIKPWLEEHCSCPVCRYKLPTDE